MIGASSLGQNVCARSATNKSFRILKQSNKARHITHRTSRQQRSRCSRHTHDIRFEFRRWRWRRLYSRSGSVLYDDWFNLLWPDRLAVRVITRTSDPTPTARSVFERTFRLSFGSSSEGGGRGTASSPPAATPTPLPTPRPTALAAATRTATARSRWRSSPVHARCRHAICTDEWNAESERRTNRRIRAIRNPRNPVIKWRENRIDFSRYEQHKKS